MNNCLPIAINFNPISTVKMIVKLRFISSMIEIPFSSVTVPSKAKITVLATTDSKIRFSK